MLDRCVQVLVAGVILITLNGSSPGAGGPNSGTREDYDLVVGLGASAASGLSSAYAGVYFEKCVVWLVLHSVFAVPQLVTHKLPALPLAGARPADLGCTAEMM